MSPAERPTFDKSPPELVERFAAALADRTGAERRPMFGYPSAFVNGNLATGLFADGWFVRLPDDQAAELLAIDGAQPFEPMAGRPMRGYVMMPPAMIADPAALGPWVDRAIEHAGRLPPKPKR